MDSGLKRRKKTVFSPLYEKILESYEAADGVCPGVFFDRFDGYEGYEDVLVCAGFLLECAHSVVYFVGFGFGEGIVTFRVFDFADVHNPVCTLHCSG